MSLLPSTSVIKSPRTRLFYITVTATDTATANVSDTFTLKVLNLFNGTSDSDNLTGTDEGDYLDAREGRDVISAGKGDDVLVGGSGGDILTGGEGNDQFVYTNIRDRGDTITDFEVGKDNKYLCKINCILTSPEMLVTRSFQVK